MPRILFLSANDLVTSGFQAQAQAVRAYRDADWDVHFAVMRPREEARANEAYSEILQVEGVQVHRWQIPDTALSRIAWAKSTSAQLDWACRLGLAIRNSTLADSPFDVIYASEFIGIAACRISGVLTSHSALVHRFFGVAQPQRALAISRARRFVSRALLHQWALNSPCDLLIMTNDGTLGDQVILKHAPQNEPKLLFLPNGVDVPDWCRANVRMRDRERRVLRIVMVSRLVGWKRVHLGLRAMALAKHRGVSLEARVIGDGPEAASLRQLANELGIESSVTFCGPVSNEQVWIHYLWADVLVSCYDWSNVGNPLFEALSVGLPVVTLANGGTSQWIKHRLNGLLCQAEDDQIPEELARALHDLQHQPGLLGDLSKGALETARSRVWSWRERMQHEIDRVSEVMGRLQS